MKKIDVFSLILNILLCVLLTVQAVLITLSLCNDAFTTWGLIKLILVMVTYVLWAIMLGVRINDIPKKKKKE